VVDHQAERALEQAGFTLQTVLEKDYVLYLRSTGNLRPAAPPSTAPKYPLREQQSPAGRPDRGP
jgi:hypothetical protein